ncbi:unnamed protein product [Adineta steineri]|uniref:Uncharacterized protein n=1 Tax=Adineta steineri TaxID=433720 RepID=A0A813RIR5_9BILA|nr:unnamed protein product [Adineta steineri]CAF3952410.1 unnamed protein product [Adineta steineri]
MVLMDGDISRCKTRVDAIEFDAISSWCNSAIQSGGKVVIPLPPGWDPRPRSEHPVPWVDQGPEHFLQPTVKELQNFFQSSIQLTCTNKNITEAQTVIVYAWNENSENGASLIPTIGNGTYYINALSEVLLMFY